MAKFEMRDWARKGAEQRLVEIAEEASAICAAFPELRDRGDKRPTAHRSGSGGANGGVAGATQKRRRRKMSAAQKKAVSERMKKYWAARRKAR